MSPRARALVFFVGCVLAAGIFGRLGIWQVSRLRERRAVNARTLAARALPPLVLDEPGAATGLDLARLNNRRVRVTGRYDHAAEVVIRGQSEGGVPGVRVVTPLRPLRGDTAILVQRGYVTSGDARRVDLAPLREEGVKVVTGLLFAQPDTGVQGDPLEQDGQLTWRRIDLAALRTRLPYPIHSYVILQLPDSTLPKLPRRDEAPALDDGPHLSYAVQWFGFAVTALVVGGIIGFRRR
jgi:surfeit locus 1 family protein